ncbi:hypothetical protein BT63DRAFT_374488 [Microthyrium microscopicum]|uniref:Zn(2)-C6 fungal-type domain-containing protein n=1 Tax=Microthyrium microscopicum TaxID=703497 RepID=A0A6A6UAK2_9PEZI|nr:hypothetical protein BT63DRAFT_374488 [Microthyrium microscopicum]
MHDTSKRKSREGDEWPPPWSELKTKAGKDRKRLPLACIACRRKKIRCSGQKPACKHCLRSRVPCVYKINTRKATPRTDYMAMLDKRLKRMEDRVIKLIPKDSEAASIPRAIVKPTTAPPGAKSPKKNRKRVADEAFGGEDDIDAWAQTTHDGLGVMPMHKESTDEDTLFLEGAAHLPSKDIQLHLAEIYFEYVYGQSYPLLHKPTFMRNLIAGTVPPVLVLAVCAISARFSQHPQLRIKPAFLRGEEWAEPARRIALKRFDQPNIAILTVYLLLGLHEFGTCHGGRSYMFGGMAQRMGLMLQLHKDRDISDLAGPAGGNSKTGGERNSHTDKEIRRRVMWSCFLMDRFISSGSERPMSIPEICIEIPLPARESLFLMEIEGITETLDGKVLEPEIPESVTKPISNMGTMAYLIRLVSIWGKMVVYFNLGGREAEKVPVWASTSRFIELQKTLQTFSFPPCLVWNSDNLETHRASKRANQFIFMHIVFQHMRLFCHRFALPGSGIVLPKDAPQSFTTEAARTAIEAANQVSNLVKEAVTSNVTAPFAGYAAFYASTVHVQGLFAKSQSTINRAKENLAINVRYLDQMKSWWGMFHFVQQDLKRLFKSHADTRLAQKAAGLDVTDDRKSQPIAKKNAAIFQYGDWMDKYPNGVSKMDYEDPARQSTDEDPANPNRGVLGAHEKELFSVDEFFDKLNKGELKPRPARQSSSSKRPRSTGPVELSRLSDDLTNTLDDNTAAPFQPSYLPNGRPLAIQTALPRSNMLASPSTAMSDLSAWPFDFMPDASQAPRAAAQANMLGLTGLPGSGSGQGMGMGMGMDLSWYMPWNLQPPMNTLGEGMAFEAASAGAQASGLGFGEFESWIGMGLDGIAGGENGKRVER